MAAKKLHDELDRAQQERSCQKIAIALLALETIDRLNSGVNYGSAKEGLMISGYIAQTALHHIKNL